MRSEPMEMRCASCGEPTSLQERAFPFGEEQALCFRCALEREGVYDEPEDRWVREPRVQDLLTLAP